MPDDVQGIPARSTDDLVKAMGMEGISKSQVSRSCGETGRKEQGFLNRPPEGLIRMETVPRTVSPTVWGESQRGQRPCVRIGATCVKARQNTRIVPVAAIIAVGVNGDGRRRVPGLDIGASGAEPFRTEFLRKRTHLGLRGVKLVISDAHERHQGGGP